MVGLLERLDVADHCQCRYSLQTYMSETTFAYIPMRSGTDPAMHVLHGLGVWYTKAADKRHS